MTLPEYINSKKYRQRIVATLESQRQKLTDKQFKQFASSLRPELDRLNMELAEYDETYCGWASPAMNRRFSRLVPMQATPQVNIAFCGSVKSRHPSEGEFLKVRESVTCRGWNIVTPTLCDCAA